MRVAMFTNTYTPHTGGVACSVESFAAMLEEMGHACHVFAPEYDGKTDDPVAVTRIPALKDVNQSGYSFGLPMLTRIEGRLKEFQPDVIHSHHPFILGDSALRMARKRACPLVFTHHTLYEQYTHNLPIDHEVIRELVIRQATTYANHCDAVIAPSQSIKKLLQSRGVVEGIHVLPTGINLKNLQMGKGEAFRAKWNIPTDAQVIGHLGRLSREKNLNYLIDSVIQTLSKQPEAHALIVGDGKDRNTLEQACRNAGEINKRIHFTGILRGQDKADAFAAMDLFAFSSQSETQGLVLGEAMATGTPVVALHGPGVDDILRDKENGFLLESDAPSEKFAGVLIDVLEKLKQENWKTHLHAIATQTAESLSRENCTRQLLDIYQRIPSAHESLRSLDEWDRLTDRFQGEWELLQEKTRTLIKTLFQR